MASMSSMHGFSWPHRTTGTQSKVQQTSAGKLSTATLAPSHSDPVVKVSTVISKNFSRTEPPTIVVPTSGAQISNTASTKSGLEIPTLTRRPGGKPTASQTVSMATPNPAPASSVAVLSSERITMSKAKSTVFMTITETSTTIPTSFVTVEPPTPPTSSMVGPSSKKEKSTVFVTQTETITVSPTSFITIQPPVVPSIQSTLSTDTGRSSATEKKHTSTLSLAIPRVTRPGPLPSMSPPVSTETSSFRAPESVTSTRFLATPIAPGPVHSLTLSTLRTLLSPTPSHTPLDDVDTSTLVFSSLPSFSIFTPTPSSTLLPESTVFLTTTIDPTATPSPTYSAVPVKKAEFPQRNGVIIGVVALVVVIIICVIMGFCVTRKKKKKQENGGEGQNGDDDDDGGDEGGPKVRWYDQDPFRFLKRKPKDTTDRDIEMGSYPPSGPSPDPPAGIKVGKGKKFWEGWQDSHIFHHRKTALKDLERGQDTSSASVLPSVQDPSSDPSASSADPQIGPKRSDSMMTWSTAGASKARTLMNWAEQGVQRVQSIVHPNPAANPEPAPFPAHPARSSVYSQSTDFSFEPTMNPDDVTWPESPPMPYFPPGQDTRAMDSYWNKYRKQFGRSERLAEQLPEGGRTVVGEDGRTEREI